MWFQISKKDAVISKLQNSLQLMEKTSRDFVTRTQQDAEKQSLSNIKTWEGKQACMQQDIDKLVLQLNTLVLENRQVEKGLRKVSEAWCKRRGMVEEVSQQRGVKDEGW